MTKKHPPDNELSGRLFPELHGADPRPKYARPDTPVWTEHKALLIQRYLKLFIQVTKHGAYIDGFAGPQKHEMQNAWSAKLVLDIRPPLLRYFFLCDKNAKSFKALKKCVAQMQPIQGRKIQTLHGDFNLEVDKILTSPYLTEKMATFALLDQRTFECKWETVRKLAAKKKGTKIELFYFFALGWVKRALSGIKRNQSAPNDWWGQSNFKIVREKSAAEIGELFVDRFRHELRYKHVTPYPIYKRHGNQTIMYTMIHATDHDDAPELMNRAYRQVVRRSQKLAVQLRFLD